MARLLQNSLSHTGEVSLSVRVEGHEKPVLFVGDGETVDLIATDRADIEDFFAEVREAEAQWRLVTG